MSGNKSVASNRDLLDTFLKTKLINVGMTKFIKGLELSEQFFELVVKPILRKKYPKLKYSACLIGRGSEVLGYDDNRSMDHDWGPRLLLFIKSQNKIEELKQQIDKELPYKFKGYPVSFTKSTHKWGVRLLEKKESGKINSKIDIYTVDSFFRKYLDFDINKKPTSKDWLTFPQQKLLSLIKGKIFHDDLNLKKVLKQFKYYPREIWLYLLTGQWRRIGELMPLHFRSKEAGDELGSKLIANQISRMLMELWFIYNKKYYPYEKWFGKSFSELPKAIKLKKYLLNVAKSENIREREESFNKIYAIIADHHNSLKLPTIPTKTSQFFDRPYKIIQGRQIAGKLYKILPKEIKKLKIPHGCIDQLINQIDIIDSTTSFKKIY